MERSAHYALIGAASTALLLVGLAFIVWLSGANLSGSDRYDVIFRGPLGGVSQGSPVEFNGIKVGEVESVALAPRNDQLVIVRAKVRKGTPVRVDSTATTAMQGISGVSAIAIGAGSMNQPLLLAKTPAHQVPTIIGRSGGLASLLQSGEKIVAGANEAIGRVNQLLAPSTVAQISAMVADLHAVTVELAAHRQIVDHADMTITRLDRAADQIERTAASARTLIDGDGRKTMANVSGAAEDLRATLRETRATIGRIDASAGEVGPNLNATLVTLQRTEANLDDLLRSLRTDPHAVIGKSRGKEVEIPR